MKSTRALVWILTISLALKLLLWGFVLLNDSTRFFTLDSDGYEKLAMTLLKTGAFSSSDKSHQPETYRTPGYPLFLAVLYGMIVRDSSVAILAQILISTACILLVYLIAQSLWGRKTALLASVLFALDMGLLGYSLLLLTETLFTFFLLCFLAMLKPIFDSPQNRKLAFYAGFFLAVATMVRPVGYYLFFPISIGLILYELWNRQGWKSVIVPVYFLVPFLVIIGGWQLRNYLLTGYGTFTRIQGTLLMKKSAEVVAMRDRITYEKALNQITDQQLEKMSNATPKSLEKIDSFWQNEGLLFLREYPGFYLRKEARRTVRMLVPAGFSLFHTFRFKFKLSRWPIGDLRRLNPANYYQKWIVSRPVQLLLSIFMLLHLFLLYAGGITAIYHAWKRRPFKPIHLFYALIFLYFLAVSLAIGFRPRFLLPALPLLHLYTARAIVLVRESRLAKRENREASAPAMELS